MTPFEELLGQYLSCGLVHSTPSVFLLAKEVRWDPVAKEIIEGNPNAWFAELAAASASPLTQLSSFKFQVSPVREFLRIAPHYHQWALWCRVSKSGSHDIHAYRWHKMAQRVGL